jgi:large subunit ribosomal protein L4
MPKAKMYNQEGKELKSVELPAELFGIEPNEDLIHQAVVFQQANSRQVLAHAKTRAEVRGGGQKPWRQKGTGRARHGSIRSPLWIGGGVTFGPNKNRNFSKRLNKKMKKKALFMVLSDRLATNDIKLIDRIKFDRLKTKQANELLRNLKMDKRSLIITEKTDQKVIKSFQNIPNVQVIRADSLNIVDLLKNKQFLITEKAIEAIAKTFLKVENKDNKEKESEK